MKTEQPLSVFGEGVYNLRISGETELFNRSMTLQAHNCLLLP